MHRSPAPNTIADAPSGEKAQIAQIVEGLKDKPGAMLPILHGIQDRIGYVPEVAVPIIADALQQTRAEVHGVISFYHHFRTRPAGAHVVYVCRAEACQALGSRQLEGHVKKNWASITIRPHPTASSPSSRCIAWVIAPAVHRFELTMIFTAG